MDRTLLMTKITGGSGKETEESERKGENQE